jgi:signal transduction histidine kinase
VEAVSGEIFSEHGEVVTVVTVLHDRTEAMERARLYEELKRASELLEERVREATAELVSQNELLRRQRLELEQASALKSQFLANMSHEFRTPLNAILGYTSLLLEGVSGPLNDKQQRNLGRVDSNAQHLLALINDILDISRIEAGRMPLTLESIDLAVLVQEVLAELEPLIARTKLSVRGASADGLPTVKSDRAKVKQVLVNLVSNAVKFTPSGSVTVDVDVHVDGRHLQMAVTDTASASIPPTRRRSSTTSSRPTPRRARYGGAGLGSRSRASRQHAERPPRAEEPSGRGLDLHLRAPAEKLGRMGKRQAPLVLIVDDFEDNREMYAQYLRFHGYEIAEAGQRARRR